MTSPAIDIVEEPVPYAERAHVVDKRGYGLFADRAGAALVEERGWRDLYVCGIATESCVPATALGAFGLDLTPWVIVDACASSAGEEAHEAGLLVTRRFIGAGQLGLVADVPEEVVASPVVGRGPG
ncbi:nicotinamidase-related amidase [Thermocatellispora tengchongensis]|uniref:Nicotinamidase-related amidase n=1 Tax=Thermocatellispora tengchongensis TaxID=1073253 RepID=A0A840PAA5_9ACTN|nr:isochorismatase family protein [Thermocatellispora tengchongensis]MBB5134340.1 nicotinamidase-related amidase [Thermocatellispora tengchongensis]